MAVNKSNTHKRTVEISNDFDPDLEEALVRQLQRGVGTNFVVGNFADLQRAGAEVVAAGQGVAGKGSGFAAGVVMNPEVDDDEAKAGAQRTLDEEAAAKNPPALADPPKATGADAVTVVDPTSSSPEVQGSKK
jgi:hypothetical protein